MRYIIILLAVLFSFNVQAQTSSKIGELRMTYLKQKLNLDSKAAQEFWPIYERYTIDKKSVYQNHTRNGNIKSKKDIEDRLNRDQEMLDLKKDYTRRMSRILSPVQIQKLNQSEKDFRNLLIKRSSSRNRASSGMRGNSGPNSRSMRTNIQRPSSAPRSSSGSRTNR